MVVLQKGSSIAENWVTAVAWKAGPATETSSSAIVSEEVLEVQILRGLSKDDLLSAAEDPG